MILHRFIMSWFNEGLTYKVSLKFILESWHLCMRCSKSDKETFAEFIGVIEPDSDKESGCGNKREGSEAKKTLLSSNSSEQEDEIDTNTVQGAREKTFIDANDPPLQDVAIDEHSSVTHHYVTDPYNLTPPKVQINQMMLIKTVAQTLHTTWRVLTLII